MVQVQSSIRVITTFHIYFLYQRYEELELKKVRAMSTECTLWVPILLGNPGIFLILLPMQLLRSCMKMLLTDLLMI
uniref:Uncharacterized protein n=1 Tax=Salix viminalis TaxID=40686 RepID=A0A6N2N9I1_SALVM